MEWKRNGKISIKKNVKWNGNEMEMEYKKIRLIKQKKNSMEWNENGMEMKWKVNANKMKMKLKYTGNVMNIEIQSLLYN